MYGILYAAARIGIAVAPPLAGFTVSLTDLSSVSVQRRKDDGRGITTTDPSFYDVIMNLLRHQFVGWGTPEISNYVDKENKSWEWIRGPHAAPDHKKRPRYETWLRM